MVVGGGWGGEEGTILQDVAVQLQCINRAKKKKGIFFLFMEQKQVCASHLPVGLQRFFSWSEQADVLYVRWVYSKGMDRFLSGCNEGWRCVQMCISLSPLVPCS